MVGKPDVNLCSLSINDLSAFSPLVMFPFTHIPVTNKITTKPRLHSHIAIIMQKITTIACHATSKDTRAVVGICCHEIGNLRTLDGAH